MTTMRHTGGTSNGPSAVSSTDQIHTSSTAEVTILPDMIGTDTKLLQRDGGKTAIMFFLVQALALGRIASAEPSWTSLTNFRSHFRACRMLKRAGEVKGEEELRLYHDLQDLYWKLFKNG